MCESQRALGKGGTNRVADVPLAPKAAAAAKPTNTPVATPDKKLTTTINAAAGAVRSALASPAPKAPVAPTVSTKPSVAVNTKLSTPIQAEKAPVYPPVTPEIIMESTMKGVQALLNKIDTAIAEKPNKATNLDYLRSAIMNVSSALVRKSPEVLPNLAAHQRALANLIGPYRGTDEKKFRNVRKAAGLSN